MTQSRFLPNNAIFALKQTVLHLPHYLTSLRVTSLTESPLRTTLITGFLIILILSITIPPKGRIVPVGKEMQQAYSLLKSTETGRELIKNVKKSTRGNLIYMILGTTDVNDLTDPSGNKVRGVTRAYFKNAMDNNYIPQGIIVYTNRDITESLPTEIVKSMAFELENVIYSMKHPGIESGKDSPYASVTQNEVCNELGL
jgi:hypothetical protein